MHFVYKCLFQHMFSVMPKGETLNYIFQRYATRTLPLKVEGFLSRAESTKMFFDHCLEYSSKNLQDIVCLDFSSGTHLQNPIGLSLLCIKKIYTYDVKRLAKPKLVNSIIKYFQKLKDKIPFDYALPDNIPLITSKNMSSVLLTCFNIKYEAPASVKDTGLEDRSIDFIVSRTTLEHIPRSDLDGIIEECSRILKKGGIAVFSIDYRDHWSFFDSRISIYNFLKYNEKKWKLYNPTIHYQNRLRHVDYMNIFEKSKLTMLKTIALFPDSVEEKKIEKMTVTPFFHKNYSRDQLLIKRGVFVLKK